MFVQLQQGIASAAKKLGVKVSFYNNNTRALEKTLLLQLLRNMLWLVNVLEKPALHKMLRFRAASLQAGVRP